MNGKRHHSPPPRGMIGPRVNYLSKFIRKKLNQAISEQGLFSGQEDILVTVVENEGITLGELAASLGVADATASVSVKRMEKAGFIYKKPDERDARIIRLYPTEKAHRAPEGIKNKMDSLEEIIKKGMTTEEAYTLSDLLQRAIDNLKNEEESL